MNKYQTIAGGYYGRSDRLGSHLDYDIKRRVYGIPESYETQKSEQFVFFRHYQKHSKQLVDAFQK
jgi:hypothetical protein